MGGVLFIDEAYYLYRPENERDYGQEAIEILLQVMENQRDDLVVILAGYDDRMDTFFRSNPGLSSRIAHHIDFPDYYRRRAAADRRDDAGRQHYRLSDGGARGAATSTSRCACASRISPTPARSATRWTGPGCGRPTGCSLPRTVRSTRDGADHHRGRGHSREPRVQYERGGRFMTIAAIIFDFDGTIADTEEAHRQAFNAAFLEHSLFWNWGAQQYGSLLAVSGGKERILAYVDSLAATPAEKARLAGIAPLVHRTKTRIFAELVETGGVPLRPGVARLLREARENGVRLAIASTTTKTNVEALLAATLRADVRGWFDVIACGDIVPAKKPAPDIYELTLGSLRVPAEVCVAIEDSAKGLAAARGAGIRTLITPTVLDGSRRLPGRRRGAAASRRFRHAARRGRATARGGPVCRAEGTRGTGRRRTARR